MVGNIDITLLFYQTRKLQDAMCREHTLQAKLQAAEAKVKELQSHHELVTTKQQVAQTGTTAQTQGGRDGSSKASARHTAVNEMALRQQAILQARQRLLSNPTTTVALAAIKN